jgi:sensor histidine kinase YesM
VGIPEAKQSEIMDSGIGISNVRQRLTVLYGQESSLKAESEAGKGTTIRIEIPELVTS